MAFAKFPRIAGRHDTLAPFFVTTGNQESIGGSGDIAITCFHSKLFSTDAPVSLALGEGQQDGQLKKLQLVHKGKEDANVVVNCPTLLGPHSRIVFDNVGDQVLLVWTGSHWCVLETGNTTDPTLRTPVVQ